MKKTALLILIFTLLANTVSAFHFPEKICSELVDAGEQIGELDPGICSEIGFVKTPNGFPCIPMLRGGTYPETPVRIR